MELALIMLTGTCISAVIMSAVYIGYQQGIKTVIKDVNRDKVLLDDDTGELLNQFNEMFNYKIENGKKVDHE